MTSFSDFYEREFRRVTALAYALTGSGTAAEELAQDGFVAAYRRWDTVAHYDDPGAWVRRVVVNACRSWGRRMSAEWRAMTRLRNRRAPLAILREPDDEFWAAVRALPKRQAQAIALHYVDDLSVDSIAEILECTTGTVKQHLFRGRQTLAQTLTTTRLVEDSQPQLPDDGGNTR